MLKPQRVRPLSDEGFDARCKHKYGGMPCMTKDHSVPLDKPGTLIIIWDCQICRRTALICLATPRENGQPTFHHSAEGLSLDRQRETGWHIKEINEWEIEGWVYKTTQGGRYVETKRNWLLCSLGRGQKARKREQLKRQTKGDGEQTKREKARYPTVDCHCSVAKGCQGCHGDWTLDWGERLRLY